MPYLTLWDKISENLAHMEGNSHKDNKSHRMFRTFYNRFYEEVKINHTVLWFSQASYSTTTKKKKKKKKKKENTKKKKKKKQQKTTTNKQTLEYILGAPKWCLRKSHTILSNLTEKIAVQILVHSLSHVCITLVMTPYKICSIHLEEAATHYM